MTKLYESKNVFCKSCNKLIVPDFTVRNNHTIFLVCPNCDDILNYLNFETINYICSLECIKNKRNYIWYISKEKNSDTFQLFDSDFYFKDSETFFKSQNKECIFKQCDILKNIIRKNLDCENCKAKKTTIESISVDKIIHKEGYSIKDIVEKIIFKEITNFENSKKEKSDLKKSDKCKN